LPTVTQNDAKIKIFDTLVDLQDAIGKRPLRDRRLMNIR